MKKKVVIFGGGLNPPHIVHRTSCEATFRELEFDELWVVPSGVRHDKDFNATREQRIAMAEIFVEKLQERFGDRVKLLLDEIQQERSCTVETYERLKREYPDVEFYFFFGSDVIQNIRGSWIEGPRLWEELNFVFIERVGYPFDEIRNLPPKTTLLESKVEEVSSTDVRKTIKKVGAFMAKSKVDQEILDYLIDQGLYQK